MNIEYHFALISLLPVCSGPKTLTEIEAHQMALTVHDRWLQLHQANPSEQTSWRTDLADRLFAPPPAVALDEGISISSRRHVDTDLSDDSGRPAYTELGKCSTFVLSKGNLPRSIVISCL